MNEGKDDLKSRLETLLDRKKEKFVKIENIYYDDEKKKEIEILSCCQLPFRKKHLLRRKNKQK